MRSRKNKLMRHLPEETGEEKKIRRFSLHARPLVLLAFCFFLYMPSFKVPAALMNIVAYGVPIVYILINLKTLRHFSSRQSMLLLFFIALLMLSCLFPLLHGTGDFSYFSMLLSSFKAVLAYVALLCLVVKKHGEENALYYFMYYYILTHVIYVAVTVLMVCIPSLQDLWFTIVNKDALVGSRSAYIFRVGWQGFSGFRLTLHCTFSVIFALYLRYGIKLPAISAKQFLVFIISCVMGNMFYGRSGLIVSIILCIIAFVHWNKRNIKRIVMIAIAVVLFVGAISLLKNIPVLDRWYNWMSAPIVNLITTGDMQDASFDRLQEMQRVEFSEETAVFGDGYYMQNGHYYMNTDAGFIRNILFWGVIGAIVSYGATLYAILGFKKVSKLIVLQLLITFLAFEYKGAVYYEFLSLAFVIEAALVIEKYNKLTQRVLE